MIIWSGWGILVVLYALAALLLGTVMGNALGLGNRQTNITIGICELLGAIAIWFTGVTLNRGADRRLLDPKTGQEVVVRRRHTLFWIPMQYLAPVVAVLGVASLINGLR